jgi:4-hydroxy-tetrahydrodipicolinate synthase
MKKLYGTGVALVTPFDGSGAIDFPALKRILTHTAKGVDYYVVMGTTGESATQSREEKKEVLDFVRKHNARHLPIVYGLGGNHTAAVLDEIGRTDLSGVDALLSVSPYYNKPSQEGIIRHFSFIADKSPVPVILYNVPGRTASNLTAATTLRLAGHERIIGIKEASGNIEQCLKILKEKPRDFMVISGDDMLTVPLYAVGAVGVISVLANAFPLSFRKMAQYSSAGQYEKARAELLKLVDINPLMYEEANPVGVKAVMHELGICGAHVRLPLLPASADLTKRIQTALEGIKKGQR